MNEIKDFIFDFFDSFGLEDVKFVVYLLIVCFFTKCKIKKAAKVKVNDLSISSFKVYQFLLNLKNLIELLKAEDFDFTSLSDEFNVDVVLEYLNNILAVAQEETMKGENNDK